MYCKTDKSVFTRLFIVCICVLLTDSGLKALPISTKMVLEDEERAVSVKKASLDFGRTPFLYDGKPIVRSIVPASAFAGDIVTIYGSNFSAIPTKNIVWFGGVKAQVTGGNDSRLTVKVPSGAAYRTVAVTNEAGLMAEGGALFITKFLNQDTVFNADSYGDRLDITIANLIANNAVDMDGDGKLDYVALSFSSNPKIILYRNTGESGNGRFVKASENTTEASVSDMYTGDLDGDGKPDVVVLNGSMNQKNISVFVNQSSGAGNISLGNRIDYGFPYTQSKSPRFIRGADMDADGKTDIIVGVYLSDTLYVYRNTSTKGQPSFANPVAALAGFFSSDEAVMADMDNDGNPDIVYSGNSLFNIWQNKPTGPGDFRNVVKQTYTGGANGRLYTLPVILDMDNDGLKDVGILVTDSSKLLLFRNTGTDANWPPPEKLDRCKLEKSGNYC